MAELRSSYSWPAGTPTQAAVSERDKLASIVQGEVAKSGRLSLNTVDEVMIWGFGWSSRLNQQQDVASATQAAFRLLAQGNVTDAAFCLGQVRGFGISRISKIIALSNQDGFGIYDSRSAHGLSDLCDKDGNRIVPIPPGRVIYGDALSKRDFCKEFANYTEVLRMLHNLAKADYEKIFPRVADIEMALFMRSRRGLVATNLTRLENPPHHLQPVADYDEESTYWTCGPEKKRTAFRVLFEGGSTTVFTGNSFCTDLTLTGEQVAECLAWVRQKGMVPLANSKIGKRDENGLGEYFHREWRVSPLFASHFASLWVTQGRLRIVGRSPLRFRVV